MTQDPDGFLPMWEGLWADFNELIQEKLGDRSHLAVSDYIAYQRLMTVIWLGFMHMDVADENCPLDVLIERHREWADSLVLSTFFMLLPALVVRYQKHTLDRDTFEREQLLIAREAERAFGFSDRNLGAFDALRANDPLQTLFKMRDEENY